MDAGLTMEGLVEYHDRNRQKVCIFPAKWLGDPTAGELVPSVMTVNISLKY